MSIESRLRDTLERAAEDAPDHERVLARALEGAAQRPVRTRRRWAAPALAAVAVLVIVGVGVAVVSDGDEAAPSDPSPPGPAEGWQELGAGDLAFSVPADWPVNPPQPCGGALEDGVVYTAGRRDCLPSYDPDVSSVEVTRASDAVDLAGVSAADALRGEGEIVRYPVERHDGVFAGVVTRGEVGLLVRSPDQALVEQILASVRAVGDDDEALVRPDLMEVAPVEASPGDLVELTYPERTMRGVAFALDELVDGAWVRRYYLTSSDRPGVEPDWWPVDDAEGRAWSDIGIRGEGPDVVLIPPPATPGDYRICTANAGDDFCATLTIR